MTSPASATPATRTLLIDGIPLHYHDLPPAVPATEQRLPLLLLHGWGADSALMLPPAQRFAALGYRVLVPDLPGFGQTPPPPAVWSVLEYAAFIVSWLDALGIERLHLVGHSFGGRLGLVLGADYAARVSRLVLADSAGVPLHKPALAQARLTLYKKVRSALYTVGARPLADSLQAAYNRRYGSSDFQQTAGVMRETFVRVVNQDLRPYAARLPQPTLLFWGDADQDTPLWQGQLLEQIIPDAGLIVFPGAGHYSYLEHPGEFIRISDHFFCQGEDAP